jgi:prepilin-type processing-associated H-X9-DG protein
MTNTILLSEVRTRDNEQDQRGAWALPWCGSTTLSFDMHAVFPLYYNTDLPKEPYAASGLPYQAWPGNLGETQRPNNTGPEQDMLYACPDAAGSQLDGMPCAQFQPNFDWGWLSAAPRSRHQGGVYASFLDGRVVFVPDNIDEYTMAYLVSPNDGQTVDKTPLQ